MSGFYLTAIIKIQTTSNENHRTNQRDYRRRLHEQRDGSRHVRISGRWQLRRPLQQGVDNQHTVLSIRICGVGAGAIQNGRFIGGISTPEMGHVRLQRHPADLNFTGICPYHHDCLEGLVAGPTFKARLGISGEDVPDNHPVWDIMAYYVAQAAVQVTAILRPQKIIFGGSVSRPAFLERVRKQFAMLWNDYLPVGSLDEYIVNPSVPGNGSATLGNFALAKHLIETNK